MTVVCDYAKFFVHHFTKKCFFVLYSWFVHSINQKNEQIWFLTYKWKCVYQKLVRQKKWLLKPCDCFHRVSFSEMHSRKQFHLPSVIHSSLLVTSLEYNEIYSPSYKEMLFLYFNLHLYIRQNRKLEKIDRSSFWRTMNICSGKFAPQKRWKFSNFPTVWMLHLVSFSEMNLNEELYLSSFLSQLCVKIHFNAMESISLKRMSQPKQHHLSLF